MAEYKGMFKDFKVSIKNKSIYSEHIIYELSHDIYGSMLVAAPQYDEKIRDMIFSKEIEKCVNRYHNKKKVIVCPECGSDKCVQTMRGVSTLVYQEPKINEDGSVEFPKGQTQMEYKCINGHYFYPKDETKIESKVIYNDKPLTKRQCAIISTFTGILIGKFEWTHEYIEEIMGRPVWTHELGNKEFYATVKEKAKKDFITLSDMAIGYNAPLGDK